MNTNEPREPASTEGAQLGDDERVDVLVEDLFIEEYPPTGMGMMESTHGEGKRALAPGRRLLRGRGKGIVSGIIVLGVIGFVALLVARPRTARKIARRIAKEMPRSMPHVVTRALHYI